MQQSEEKQLRHFPALILVLSTYKYAVEPHDDDDTTSIKKNEKKFTTVDLTLPAALQNYL